MPAPILNPHGADALTVSKRALLLDRDGVINVNFGYVHTPETTEWVDGIEGLCEAARISGLSLVVVTNQAGIGRGLYSEAQFTEYTMWMLQELFSRGIEVLRVYYCPHHPSAGQGIYKAQCACRKPAPGMILAAARDMGIDLAGSVMVGDKASDMQAALAAGVGCCIQIEDSSGERMAGVVYVQDLGQAREVLLHA